MLRSAARVTGFARRLRPVKLGSARERQSLRFLCAGLELPKEWLPRAKLVHRALIEDVPAIHQHDAVEQPQQFHSVHRYHHARVGKGGEKASEDLGLGRGVEACGRLVEQYERARGGGEDATCER